MTIEIIPATAELLRDFYGEDVARTVRAVVAMQDGKMVGVGGYYVDGQRAVIFSDLSEYGMTKKKAIVKATRATLDMVQSAGLVGTAIRQTEESATYLEHFGFIEYTPGVYEWHGYR